MYFSEKPVNSISSVGTQLSIWLELRFPHEASTAGICPFQISANTMMWCSCSPCSEDFACCVSLVSSFYPRVG